MSTQRGNVKKKAPKHQNTFAFRHNPKSKKTEKILASPICGLCDKCHKQIQWRKQYRKYKPLTQPGNCVYCRQKCVTSAYHAACDGCAMDKNLCAKCCESKDIVPSEGQIATERLKRAKEIELVVEGMRERERRAYMRRIEREQASELIDAGSDLEIDNDELSD